MSERGPAELPDIERPAEGSGSWSRILLGVRMAFVTAMWAMAPFSLSGPAALQREREGRPPGEVEAALVTVFALGIAAVGVLAIAIGIVHFPSSARETPASEDLGALLAIVLGAGALLVGALGFHAWLARPRRFAARHQALAGWASLRGGRVSRSIAALDAWLSAHWRADVVARESNRSGAEIVELIAGGHPTLVIVAAELDPLARGPSRPHVRVLLAAPSGRPLVPSATLDVLRDAGFEVAASEVGLSAEAPREAVAYLRRHPRAVEKIGQVVDLLARLADELAGERSTGREG